MRLLSDENMGRTVVRALHQAGHDVISVHDQGWHRSSDITLLAQARRDKRIILTHDRDFIGHADVSVILVRFRRQRPRWEAARLVALLDSQDYVKVLKQPVLLLVTETTVTVHRFR